MHYGNKVLLLYKAAGISQRHKLNSINNENMHRNALTLQDKKLDIQLDRSYCINTISMTRDWTDIRYLPISYRHTCWISLWSTASSRAVWKEVKALLI